MNSKELQQFIKAFADFIQDAEKDFDDNLHRQESKMIVENEIEKKAEELEITVDYYLAEFT